MKSLKDIILESQENKYYVNIILVSPDDEILIMRRANYMRRFGGKWGFPGGAVDKKDKNNKEASIRELKEETGIELTWNEEHNCKLFDSINNSDNSISEYYIVNLETKPEVKISREHSAYKWVNDHEIRSFKGKFMPDVFQIIQKVLD